MKTKFIIAVIFITSVNSNIIGQTINIASGQTITKKSANAEENSKAIPVSIGVDYFKHQWFYLTINFSYQKRDYISTETVQLNYLMLNTAIDFYFTKEYKVRPFIGLGGHNSFLLDNNLGDTGFGNQIELNNSVYGIFIRYGARQKFSKFEIAVIVETYHNLNGLGNHSNKVMKGNTGSVMFFIGFPLSKK